MKPLVRLLAISAIGFLSTSELARADFTVATFADPALDGSTPLFELDGSTFSGAWSGTGLTLETPGLTAPDYDDATFTTTVMTIVGPNDLSGGMISFFDSGGAPLFDITFDSAFVLPSLAFGASDFLANNVVFSGPIIVGTLEDEAFAFSFANPVETATGWTVTAAFTSSAIPEPAMVTLLAFGMLLGIGRRR